jgi:hypothetical protein
MGVGGPANASRVTVWGIIQALGFVAVVLALIAGWVKAQTFSDKIAAAETRVANAQTQADMLAGRIAPLTKQIEKLEEAAALLDKVGGVAGLKDKLEVVSTYSSALEQARAISPDAAILRPIPQPPGTATTLKVTIQPAAAGSEWIFVPPFGDPNGDHYGPKESLVKTQGEINSRLASFYSAEQIDEKLKALQENIKITLEYASNARAAALKAVREVHEKQPKH